jgi:hypothetical protein
MFRKSNLLTTALVLAATGFTMTVVTATVVVAMPIAPVGDAPASLIESVRWCPGGTHQGYEGKYCWRNHNDACPRGFHLGYEGKHCWRND